MNHIDTIIFDLDGTLLNTLGDLSNSVNFVLERHALPKISIDDTRRFVGNGVGNLMKSALGSAFEESLFNSCLQEFSAHYEKNMEILTVPYPGILDLLNLLGHKGYRMAVVSNKFDGAVKVLVKKYFGGFIHVAIGESKSIARKPAPDTVFKALDELGADINSAVYVGDSDVDIATAKNAGIPCISVGWGFRDKEFLKAHGAGSIIDEPAELPDLLHG